MTVAHIVIKPGAWDDVTMRPFLFQHQIPIGIDLHGIPCFIRRESNRQVEPVGERIEIILCARIGPGRDQIDEGHHRRTIDRVGTQLNLQRSMREEPLITVGPVVALQPDGHTALKSVIFVNVFNLILSDLNHIGPVIRRHLGEFEDRHIGSAISV